MQSPENSPEKSTPVEELTYEEAFNELDSIVSDLESEQHSLEQTLALFERGQALARHCTKLLEAAELKVQQLSEGDLVDLNSE
jgi:exodeoxyribonuclease VII small subunit